MIERRSKREIYFQEQDFTTEKYVVPYIEQALSLNKEIRVLEIGCGEGGNLRYFVDLGCEVVGVDLNTTQIERAKELIPEFCKDATKTTLLAQNIYDTTVEEIGQFDLIMMRDVIEHIPNQDQFISFLHRFIKKEGVVFLGFPPWYMPFGGHQQGCKSFLKKVPYFHILPQFMYKRILKLFGENEHTVSGLLQTKATGISIERFKRIVNASGWKVFDESLYLINPNYEVKFKLQPKKQFGLLGAIPFFRNFVTTCAYYLITPKQ